MPSASDYGSFRLSSTAAPLIGSRFANELGRYTYITPTSYLTLISSFKQLLSEKQQEVRTAIQRYEGGLGQLEFFSVTITGMQKDIEELQPKLVVAQKEAEAFIEVGCF
ncbi:dynein heavy chain 7, axonemal [Trichonephila inaurata madagascariensis]|uniref:Dynein heavy chain 7, axonemal n=1 Tax=Trichonephila inaurata madagascariensis TaxID=2747483 RepID=A0A8X6IFR4_9ARAC|nr:dynein heavy chain 7, axonemal [Trichonephila inaurata madagascariensis]